MSNSEIMEPNQNPVPSQETSPQPMETPVSQPDVQTGSVVMPPAEPQIQVQSRPREPSIAGSILGGIFSWFVVPIAIVLFLHLFVFQAFHVVGSSMYPTLKDSDYLIISKVEHTVASVEHKDYIPPREQIIVFHYPKDPSLVFVKRVIGLPGERVKITDGEVKVYNTQHPNGFDPNTGYEQPDTQTLIDTDVVVPQGNVFVLGDNRTPNGSSDSRDWGFLPASDIIGNAVARLIPIDQARIF